LTDVEWVNKDTGSIEGEGPTLKNPNDPWASDLSVIIHGMIAELGTS